MKTPLEMLDLDTEGFEQLKLSYLSSTHKPSEKAGVFFAPSSDSSENLLSRTCPNLSR
jgi:hypothetical protein